MAFLRSSSVYCITEEQIDRSGRFAFSSLCLTTSSMSVFGACTQLRAWKTEMDIESRGNSRRVPSSNPRILFCLALADLFACIGVIGMSIIFMSFEMPVGMDYRTRPAHMWYVYVGAPIETLTMYSYVTAYMWTFVYALDVCLQSYSIHHRVGMKFYHIISWIMPAWIVGFGQWGFVYDTLPYCSVGSRKILHYMVCYIPLLFTMVTVPILYFLTHRKVRRDIARAHGMYTNIERQLLKAVRWKFFMIFLVFAVCWILNFADGLHDIIFRSESEDSGHYYLWMAEACINPLQGFLNCLVYGKQNQFSCCNCEDRSLLIADLESPTQSEPSNETYMINSQDTIEPAFPSRGAYSESSPLISGTSLGTSSPSVGPYRPFVARLLGEPTR